MKIKVYKNVLLYLNVCNSTEELFKTIEKLYGKNIDNCRLYALNKKYYLVSKTAISKEFIAVKYYLKGLLDEYAKLLSVDAINEIGKSIRIS